MVLDSKQQLNVLQEDNIIEVKLRERLSKVQLVPHFGRLLESLILRLVAQLIHQ